MAARFKNQSSAARGRRRRRRASAVLPESRQADASTYAFPSNDPVFSGDEGRRGAGLRGRVAG